MKARYLLFRRTGIYYTEDTLTRKQHGLRTRDKADALKILNAKNEPFRQPVLNLQIARAYLTASDPAMAARTWQVVMDQMQTQGKDSSQIRYTRAMKAKAFDGLRHKRLLETNAEDYLRVLKGGQVSVSHFLKRLHNLALGLGWIAVPILAPKLWLKPHFKPKRAITAEEHQRILAAETNRERNLYYQFLWEVRLAPAQDASLAPAVANWRDSQDSSGASEDQSPEVARLRPTRIGNRGAMLRMSPRTPNWAARLRPAKNSALETQGTLARLRPSGTALFPRRAKPIGFFQNRLDSQHPPLSLTLRRQAPCAGC